MADTASHGDLADAHEASNFDGENQETEAAARASQRDLSRDVVFIDGDVEDIGGLLAELDADVEVHILDLEADGVEQIATILDGREDLAAVHIFSHGGQGFLNLGSSELSSETVTTSHVEALTRIGASLGEDGDILIYGCDFGAGEAGRALAAQLATITGADIAASDDLTGDANLGGDWDLEVVQGKVETDALTFTGFKGVLGAFELGTVDPPTVTYVNGFVPGAAPQFGEVGEAGTVAVWENAGTVDTPTGTISVDVRATVVSVTNDAEIFVGFGTRDNDEGDTDDVTIDDFRVYVHNTSAVAGGSNTGNIGSAEIVWEIFESGTNQTVKADIGEVSLTTADIDGTGPGTITTRETLSAAISDLSSYTVQAGTNLEVSNDGTFIRATGTADQSSELTSWVQYSWNSVNELTMTYESRTPYAYFNHDGDGDLVFTNPNTAFATGIDLDDDDSSGAAGSNYQAEFLFGTAGIVPVEIADGDIIVSNDAGTATSATIVLTNALAGDVLTPDNTVLANIGLASSVDTSVPGQITVTLTGNASAVDYQTAIQSVTYSTTSTDITVRSIDVQVFDGAFASGVANTATSFRTVLNEPTATRDLYVGDEDTTLNVSTASGLLANDTDPQPTDTLSVAQAFDGDGVEITVNVVGAPSPVVHVMPSGALLTLFDDGSFDYEPPADFSGVEFFDYVVSEDNGNLSTSYASINIRGVADTPNVPTGLTSAVGNEDEQSAVVDLTSTQSDSDGSESLRYSISAIPAGFTVTDGTRSFTSTSLTDIAFLDEWDVTNISLIPPSPDQHDDTDVALQLTVSSSEPNGSTTSASDTVTFQFAAVADAPVVNVAVGSAGPGAMLNINPLVSAVLVDTDGSESILQYQFSNIPAGATFYLGTTPLTPSGGVVTVQAADFLNLKLEVPTTLGAYSVDVIAVSEESNPENQVAVATAQSAIATLNFSVDNIDDPVTANDDAYTAFAGQTITINPLQNDDVPDGGPTIISVDGQAISVGSPVVLTDGSGTVSLNSDGTLTFTASGTLSGQATFDYVVEDADLSVDTATITINAPTWSITGDASAAEGASASYTISLDAVPPAGTAISVDISAINIDTTDLDYSDLAAAVQAAADASTNYRFDGTTLTYVPDYTSQSLAGSNFQDISADPAATALGIGLFDPTNVSLGFDFDFYAETYSDVFISDFGILTFGAASPGGGPAYQNTSFSGGNTLGGLPAIAPFWDVIGMDRVNSDDVYTLTQGLPGEREFIVQYNDVVIYFNDNAAETITFQAVLREGSNEIEFRYDDATLTSGTYNLGASATIGLSDGTGKLSEEFSFNTASLSDDSRIVFNGTGTPVTETLTFTIDALSDTTFEADEDFQIVLGNAQNSAVNNTLDDVTTTITDTNQAPVHTVPVTSGAAIPATTTVEDTPLVFNAANGNEISINDPDGDALTVTLTATNGTLAVAGGSGATVAADGTAVVTISGTQAQINAALDGLSFISTADYNGTATITVQSVDNEGAQSQTTTSTIDIAITPDADIVSDWQNIPSGTSVTIDVLANDSFEGPITSLTATPPANGSVVVNGDNTITYTWTGGVEGGLDNFTYTVTSGGVTETATVAIVKQQLPQPTDDVDATSEDTALVVGSVNLLDNDISPAANPVLAYDTVDLSAAPAGTWDDASNSYPFSWSDGITLNSAPTSSLPGITESLVFDGTEGALATDLQSLPGNPSDNDATFEILFKYDPADYSSGRGAVLYETGGGGDGMSIALSDSNGTGSGTIDHLLVTFNNNNAGGDTITQIISLEDVVGPGNISGEFIQVSVVYDRDASGTDDALLTYVNGTLVASDLTAALNDWDGGSDAGLGTTVNGTNLPGSEFGLFTGEIAGFSFYEAALSGGEVKNTFDAIGGLTITSHDTVSANGAAVVVNSDGTYSYDPTSAAAIQALQAGDILIDTFTYTVTDGNGVSSDATVSIVVVGVNDAPAGTDAFATLAEDGSHVFATSEFGFTDPVDGVDDNFLSVIVTSVPADGTLIFDDGVSPATTVTAGQTISAADIAAGFLSFVPVADENNTSTAGPDYTSFTFQVVDDGGTANGGVDTDATPNVFTLSVTPQQDAPLLSVPGAQAGTEDTVLPVAGITVADIDGDALTTTLSVPVGSGTIAVAASGATITGNGSGTVTLVGSAADINTALAGLIFTPTDDFNTGAAGSVDLSVSVSDSVDSDDATVALSLVPVADITPDSVSTNEDTALSFDPIAGTSGATADNFEDAGASVTAVTQGTNGSVVINVAGGITYTPNTNFFGTDTFTYTVTAGGVEETTTVTVDVAAVNDDPTADDETFTTAEETAITIDVLTGDGDIDGDPLTITEVDGQVITDGGPAVPVGNGTVALVSGELVFTPALNYVGSASFTYTIVDGEGGSTTATVSGTVTPVNDAPEQTVPVTTGTPIAATTTPEDTPLVFNAANGNALTVSDVDGDTVTTTVTVLNGILNVAASSATVSDDGTASVTITGSAADVSAALDGLTYTNSADYVGTDQLAIVTDDGSLSVSDTIDLGITAVADVVDDAVSTIEDTPVAFNVLTGAGGADADNFEGPAAVVSTTTPANGEVTFDAAGNITYTPNASFNGVDSFQYTVSANGTAETATVTITVDPANDAPTIIAPANQTGTEDSTLAISGVTVGDIDGDTLTTTVTIPAAAGTLSVDTGAGAGVSGDGSNSITLSGSAAQINAALAALAYQPTADFNTNGAPPFNLVIVTDDGALSDSASIAISVGAVDDVRDDTVTTNEDTALTFNALTGTSGATADTFENAGAVVSAVTQGVNGSVTFLPDGTITYTPDANTFGIDTFTYTVASGGVTETATVSIDVLPINDAPVATDNTYVISEDTDLTANVITDDTGAGVDSDIDGPSISVSAFVVSGEPGPFVLGLPYDITGVGDLTIQSNGAVLFEPDPNFTGALPTVTYTLSDGFGGTHTALLDIAVSPVPDAPETLADSFSGNEDDASVTGNVIANDSDPDGDSLAVSEFSVTGVPGTFAPGATATIPGVGDLTVAANGDLTFIPAENFNGSVPQVSYTVTDGGLQASSTIDISITPQNDAPDVSVPDTSGGPVVSTTTDEDTALIFSSVNGNALVVADVDGDMLTTTVTVSNGILTANTASSASISSNNSASVTISGTAAEINAALSGLSYSPNADLHGLDSLDIQTTDGSLTASGSVAIAITSVVDVVDDTVTTNEDQPANFNVLTGAGGAEADNFEGTPQVTSVTQPANGFVSFNANGDMIYTPDPNFNGTDTFTYTVNSNGFTETGTVTLTVTPVNDGPVGVDDVLGGVVEDGSGFGNVLDGGLGGQDFDVD
ncbi:MAG: tandem-95 repeat protein, partial [Pseudomonadota bacterium]